MITISALLQRDSALVAAKWHLAMLDEAQAIKSPDAKVSIAARALQATQRVYMAGTPMENNLGDPWSLMSFVNPGLLGTSRQFAASCRAPIEREGETARFDALCTRIALFMLRRTKAQVLARCSPSSRRRPRSS